MKQRTSTVELAEITKMVETLEEDRIVPVIRFFAGNKPETPTVKDVLQACNKGIAGVAERYEKGQYQVGDIIYAMEMMAEIESILMPLAREVLQSEAMETVRREETLIEELLSLDGLSAAM